MIVIFPTETVYGVGATFDDMVGVDKIYELKGRDYNKPFSLHISPSVDYMELIDEDYLEIARPYLVSFAKNFWPGPLTILVKPSEKFCREYPKMTSTGFLGLRCPDMPVFWEFVDWAGPVWGTSLNVSGEPEVIRWDEIPRPFLEAADVVLMGRCLLKEASTVVKLIVEGESVSFEVLREGAINSEQVAETFKFE